MSIELDDKKLEQMWNKILKYEQIDSIGDKKPQAIQKITKIIDEVYRQCY